MSSSNSSSDTLNVVASSEAARHSSPPPLTPVAPPGSTMSHAAQAFRRETMPSLPSLATGCGPCNGEHDPSAPWSAVSILQYQKACDLLIALAYLSIPLELFYFVSCSAVFPFSWVFLQFGGFIVLCGLTHLVTAFALTPHSFLLFLALTVLKFLTALVSLATAVSLLSLIPQILRFFVREGLLRQKARELHRDLGRMRRQEAAAWRVPMLTADIRRSLDHNTILDTTLVQLSAALSLRQCAIWMPDCSSSLSLTHQLHGRLPSPVFVSSSSNDVVGIVSRKGVVILDQKSYLARATMSFEAVGPVAATRVPLFEVANFGEPAMELIESSYAILVAVMPDEEAREWASQELEIMEVVADQVAVALSHAAILHESLLTREKLLRQNTILNRARQDALLARQTREAFRSTLAQEITGTIRSIGAVLSKLQCEKLSSQQERMMGSGLALFSLIEEAAVISRFEEGELELVLRQFSTRAMLEEAVAISRLLCAWQGVGFESSVRGKIPRAVVGDMKRVFQALCCMMGNVLGLGDCRSIFLQIIIEESGHDDSPFIHYGTTQQNLGVKAVNLKFGVSRIGLDKKDNFIARNKHGCDAVDPRNSFILCGKLARVMHGSISILLNSATEATVQLDVRLPYL